LKAVEELGYVPNLPARMLVKGQNLAVTADSGIGIIVSTNAIKYSHAFFTPVLEGIEIEIVKQGKKVAFIRTLEELGDPATFLATGNSLDGLIFVGCPARFEIIEKLKVADIPSILVEFYVEGMDSVMFDRDQGMRLIIDHLTRCGHKHIGYLCGLDRMKSFMKVMNEWGFEIRPEWCSGHDEWTMEAGYIYGQHLLDSLVGTIEKPTAVVAGSDDIAAGFMRACRDRGIDLPDEMSIASFDDNPLAPYLYPRLTTVSMNKPELGRIAVQKLVEKMGKAETTTGTVIRCPVSLMIRDSVAKIKN
jgi:DNA-binding LacI/PurR family transcriptional regulator